LDELFNPLDKLHLGESIRDALLKSPIRPLIPGDRFAGAGVYAIYYSGDFPVYGRVAERNRNGKFELPIYVGEAVPPGSRKGGLLNNLLPNYKLHARLREHAKSIGETINLRIEDFHFRCLVVDDIWIPLGEALMIESFAPVWNKVIDGFGIHTPGGNRRQTTSAWDTLHPGRAFVERIHLLPNPKSQEQLAREVSEFLDLPKTVQEKRPTLETGE
jgi:Eco29kI restriction endonuclease